MKSLIILLFTFLGYFSSILSIQTSSIKKNSIQIKYSDAKKCTRNLENVLYKPENCAYIYLRSIAYKFLPRSQIIFKDQEHGDAFIYNFEAEYGVKVDLIDPFGHVTKYHPNGTKSHGLPNKYTDSAQAYLNFGGFVRQVNQNNFFYTFQIFSPDGQYIGVTLYVPLSEDPLVC